MYVDIVYRAQVINARRKEYGGQNEREQKLAQNKAQQRKIEEMRSNLCTQFGTKESIFFCI